MKMRNARKEWKIMYAKEWKIEYAKTSRSSCRTCRKFIKKEMLRLGKVIPATKYDGVMTKWNHTQCILKRPNKISSPDDVEGMDLLRWEDQKRMRRYIQTGIFFNTTTVGVNERSIEVSQTCRAVCKLCNKKITEGEIRISTKPGGEGTGTLAWHHAYCYMEWSHSTNAVNLSGWNSLTLANQGEVHAYANKDPFTGNRDILVEVQGDEELPQKPLKGGVKRKRSVSRTEKSKINKSEWGASFNKAAYESYTSPEIQMRNSSDLESEVEAQNKALWAIKTNLKEQVTIAEMRKMLEANDQHSAGSELDLREICADGMLFGPLGSCPICSGSLRYSGAEYRCHGYVSEWTKCSYSTAEPIRLKREWRIPQETSNEYLCKWFKSQKGCRSVRILPTLFSNQASGSQSAFKGLKAALIGVSEDSMGKFKQNSNKARCCNRTNCLVVGAELDCEGHDLLENKDHFQIIRARKLGLPILRLDYLIDCTKRQKRLPLGQYLIEPSYKDSRGSVTLKVNGNSVVHETSGMQGYSHILEDAKYIYSTTLNKSDLSIGVNSCYVMQIIQEDKRTNCYLFREWGRTGNEQIGGNKLDEMSKAGAIREFKRLFLEKTGNHWEAWEKKENFQKQPGKYFPLDIDYGVSDQVLKIKEPQLPSSRLAQPVQNLMKMLFNVETYRSAMIELEIDMSEMPLGKLSKSNIQMGFSALTDIQNLLASNNQDLSVRESLLIDASNRFFKSLLIDASNRFFSIIPSTHPRIIRDARDLRSKVEMLEALQDIEIASRIIGFNAECDESLDEKYEKLHCNILPLPRDCDDYQLEWTLELEDVFSLDREGEFDKFAPYRERLQNKMLLWHEILAPPLFVGILSHGLRIAPPEVPSSGYMFGKGIYFADLVSKSAQYCRTSNWNPVGLLLLSEVALGNVYELKKAWYMEKPPEGKNSTKGLGKKAPQKSDYVTWKNNVAVPCGKPVTSNAKTSELMYNEYIVYDTAQVKMQFLVKVKFHHKR
ncbi:hypothetical protein MKX03_036768 [Papaver bracteatum]|nr:hypothetical protein MKX03_036768 [Papaver bracteatum]